MANEPKKSFIAVFRKAWQVARSGTLKAEGKKVVIQVEQLKEL